MATASTVVLVTGGVVLATGILWAALRPSSGKAAPRAFAGSEMLRY
jgi:hypothetical protein